MGRRSALNSCQGNRVGANVNPTLQKIKDRGFKLHLNLRLVGSSTIFWPKDTPLTVLTFRMISAVISDFDKMKSEIQILTLIMAPCSPLTTRIYVFVKYPRREALPVRLRLRKLVSMTTAGTLRSCCSRRVCLNMRCHLVDG